MGPTLIYATFSLTVAMPDAACAGLSALESETRDLAQCMFTARTGGKT